MNFEILHLTKTNISEFKVFSLLCLAWQL